MGILFSCCFNIKGHPTENSNASILKAISSAPNSPASETPSLPPQVSNNTNIHQIHPHNVQPKPQSSEPHVAVSIPDTTQDDQDVLLHVRSPTSDRSTDDGFQASEPPLAVSVSDTTQVDDLNFVMNSMKIESSSCSEMLLLPKFNNEFYEEFLSPHEEEECPTCLEEYNTENPKMVTECFHHFHLGCIYEWMERSDTCPVCSRVMVFREAGEH